MCKCLERIPSRAVGTGSLRGGAIFLCGNETLGGIGAQW